MKYQELKKGQLALAKAVLDLQRQETEQGKPMVHLQQRMSSQAHWKRLLQPTEVWEKDKIYGLLL